MPLVIFIYWGQLASHKVKLQSAFSLNLSDARRFQKQHPTHMNLQLSYSSIKHGYKDEIL